MYTCIYSDYHYTLPVGSLGTYTEVTHEQTRFALIIVDSTSGLICFYHTHTHTRVNTWRCTTYFSFIEMLCSLAKKGFMAFIVVSPPHLSGLEVSTPWNQSVVKHCPWISYRSSRVFPVSLSAHLPYHIYHVPPISGIPCPVPQWISYPPMSVMSPRVVWIPYPAPQWILHFLHVRECLVLSLNCLLYTSDAADE